MDLFKLLGTISINNADANRALDDTSRRGEQTEGKLKGAFSAVGKGALAVGKTIATGLAVGATAMTGVTTMALSAVGELEQNMGGSEAVFGEYAAKMQETAKSAFSTMGLSTSNYLATANKMGSLFKGAGFEASEAADITSQAMQRAADVASIMGISTEAAMESIAGAAKGNFTMMDNLGVAMNDTTLNAYALEKGIGKTTQEMTNQEKIGLAMQMFMEKTADYAGNYTKENETLAGSLGTAKAALTNFLDGSGDVDQLVNAFTGAVNSIIGSLETLAPRLVNGMVDLANKIMPMIPDLLGKLLPIVLDGATSLINGIVAILPQLVDLLTSSVIPQLLSAIVTITNALVEALPSVIESIVSALPALLPQLIDGLVSAIVTLCSNFAQIIQPIIDYLPDIIISVVDALMTNLPILIDGLITLVLGVVEAIPQIIQALIDAIPMIVESVVTGLLNSLPELIMGFIKLFAGVVIALPQILLSLNQALPKAFEGIWNGIKNVFSNVGGFFKEAFGAAWEAIKNVFSGVGDFFMGIWDKIKNAFSAIGTKIGDAISGAVKKGINGLIGIAENIINGFLGMINGAIGMINKIPGVNISKVKLVKFTRLAEGGVVDEPTPAVFGEDGAEAVVPLENNTGWIRNVAKQLHTFTVENKKDYSATDSIRTLDLQQQQVSEMRFMNNKMDRIIDLLVQFFPDMVEALDINMYLDTGVLVAETASQYDVALGKIAVKKGRGR